MKKENTNGILKEKSKGHKWMEKWKTEKMTRAKENLL